MGRTFTQYLILLLTVASSQIFAQGEVGFGTNTPAEKADVNGAIIVRGDYAAAIPVAGSIRWNSTDGMHDGRVTAGSWIRLENDNEYLNGDYTALVCGTSSTISAGNVSGTSTSDVETPFSTGWDDKRGQYLYYGSDMVSGGLCAGYITQIGFNIVVLGAPAILNGLQLKLKQTTTTSLTGTVWESGLLTYYSGAVTLGPGPNYISLTSGLYPSGFYWDGYSSILLEICYDNTTRSITTTVDITSGLAYTATRTNYANFVGGCGMMTAAFTSNKRPVLYLTGNSNGPVTGVGDYIYFEKAVIVGSPVLPAPDVSHGPGSVTAEAVYDENIIISDYVFDHYFDGRLKEKDELNHNNYRQYSIDEMVDYMQKYRHLPTIRGRDDWENGRFSVGELSTELWVTYETNALYLKELNDRLTNAEAILGSTKELLINAYDLEIKSTMSDTTLTEVQKSLKINRLNNRINELLYDL